MRKTSSGFTLMETAVTMAIIALMTVGMISVSNFLLSKTQLDSTIDGMRDLRRAISGNPVIVVNEARTSFGYLGDMGNLPTSLEDLWVKGSQPAFTFDTSKKAGAGWNGPYLDVGTAELISARLLDGWGNSYSFNKTTFTDSSFGATALGKLVSLGPDLALDTADDISILFFSAETVSRVQGYVKDTDDNAIPGVGVTINYPANGALTSQLVQTDSTGYYSISNMPFGNRSVTISPTIVLAPDTTVVSGPSNEDMKFTIKNFAGSDITFTSMTVTYTITPDAWFKQIKVGNTTVYDSTSPRFGTGDTVTFSAETVDGTGLTSESIAVNIQSPVTDIEDLVIGDTGRGGSLSIEFNDFNSAETGNGGTAVDLTGVSFEITFKNGATVVGTLVVQP